MNSANGNSRETSVKFMRPHLQSESLRPNGLPWFWRPIGRASFLVLAALLTCAASGVRGDEVVQQTETGPAGAAAAQEELVELAEFRQWLGSAKGERPQLGDQPWAKRPLSRQGAAVAKELLWQDYCAGQRMWADEVLAAKQVSDGTHTMRFESRVFGERPAAGHSLYLSLHGGGGAPTAVNDGQWRNQQRLYELSEGIYIAPRAPTDTWNLWHQGHVDDLFRQIIRAYVITGQVDANRVYVMGYSAGGDGVYQIGPRMADSWAAAAMMAGHPNEASPLNLRNIGFSIHMGELDKAYDRNNVARRWGDELDRLQQQDPGGYSHETVIHPGKGHWMDRQDKVALEFLERHTRNPNPTRVVWRQDDVTRGRFYWLAVGVEDQHEGRQIVVTVEGQMIVLETESVTRVQLRLNDTLLDLDQPVTVRFAESQLFSNEVPRTLWMMERSMNETGDPEMVWSAEIQIDIPPAPLRS